jgi:hypothetical protein
MLPLELKLAIRAGKTYAGSNRRDFTPIKRVASRVSLQQNPCQIAIDGRAWRRLLQKSMQLRMVPVTLCLATQHRSGEKTLPPKRHKTLGIEILWMECPEAHNGVRSAQR